MFPSKFPQIVNFIFLKKFWRRKKGKRKKWIELNCHYNHVTPFEILSYGSRHGNASDSIVTVPWTLSGANAMSSRPGLRLLVSLKSFSQTFRAFLISKISLPSLDEVMMIPCDDCFAQNQISFRLYQGTNRRKKHICNTIIAWIFLMQTEKNCFLNFI